MGDDSGDFVTLRFDDDAGVVGVVDCWLVGTGVTGGVVEMDRAEVTGRCRGEAEGVESLLCSMTLAGSDSC